jgi:cathepsin L
LVLFAALVACVAAVPLKHLTSTDDEDALFETFKRQYGKTYNDQHDEQFRKQVFIQNLQMIREHNEAAQHSYTLAMNKFGDLTFDEFHTKYTGYRGVRNQYIRSQNYADLSDVKVADSVDWVAAGAVTGVKDQGQCGSCWAFSSTGSLEGAWFVAKGQLISLSEQELMDCSKSEGNGSCEGGWMDSAFEYVIQNKGICTEASYPYLMQDESTCNTCTNVVSISSYSDVAQTEADLLAAVNKQPVSVAIEADQQAFQFYSSGVLTGTCGQSLDHGVLVVGYGTLDGTDYWKVKNSWGTTWGMNGYVLIERGIDQCGIHNAASFPVV